MLRNLTCALLGLVLLATGVRAEGAEWFADFDKAVAQAKAEGKDLLVDFTGSDWCGWCIKLHKEVFDHAEWSDAAAKNYVLVALDFPRGNAAKGRVPNPERNAELKQLHKVTGFPTVLLMSAEGELFGRLGYKAGGPKNYLGLMRQMRRQGRAKLERASALLEALKLAQGEAREPALLELLGLLKRSSATRVGRRYLLAGARLALGDDFPIALRARSLDTLLEVGELDEELFGIAIAMDPKGKLGLQEHALRLLVEAVTDKAAARAAMPRIAAFHALGVHVHADRASHVLALGAFWAKTILEDQTLAKTYAQSGLRIGNTNLKVENLMRDIVGD